MERNVGLTVYVRQMSFTHPLPRGRAVRVGRGAQAAIRVDDASVSRQHAEILFEGKEIWVEDLGSSNGTKIHRAAPVQGRAGESVTLRAHQRYSIRPGDVLHLGGVSALLQMEQPAPADERSTTPPRSGAGGRILFDPEMKRIYELAARAACSDINVLIMGETGVGKELLAASVHENSRRSSQPFLQLNCAALGEALLESELFGHERGAFTGASSARKGLLESAQGGTVFLDEVGEMPPSTQAKLLRVLEERQIRRLGSTRKIDIDVRFVAATNRDMATEVATGGFREDLFYRISGINLKIPPLRERRSEIEPLARHFLMAFCLKSGIAVPEISAAGLEQLLSYSWPGNVRELKNAMERAPFFSAGAPLQPEHLPTPGADELGDDPFPDESTDVRPVPRGRTPSFRSDAAEADRLHELLEYDFGTCSSSGPIAVRESGEPTVSGGVQAKESAAAHVQVRSVHGNSKNFSEEEERERVVDALEACAGNQTRAAEMLGISRRTLINRMEAFGIPRPRKQR